MKTRTSLFAAAAVAASLALAGAAFGHPGFGGGPGYGPGYGYGPGMGMGMGMMGHGMGMGPMGMGHGPGMMGLAGADVDAILAARLAALKERLKITPAQEGAWKAYESAVTQHAKAMQSGHEAQDKALADLDAVLTPEQQSRVVGGWGPLGYGRR
ncbi:MAG TPA: hypothetical protein VFM98_09465 [Ramlibacter sp.]|uniref:hypothetical protein n=1 Tax=Ramlibacter sp. TaxID=1917967 RepID=UPI002D8032F5|nr:hypothetical protein [Ramlibacter sp.]HET8745824.1 hypothetical protein [Ramlibacter sp.]